MDRRSRLQKETYISRTGDVTIRGTASHIVTQYEGLAYQAGRDKDDVAAHQLFQAAEHYKRIQKEEKQCRN